MMSAEQNPLDRVWEIYATSMDCLKVADRVRKRQPSEERRPEDTGFLGLGASEADQRLRTCRKELEDLLIISLWAVFERFLIDRLLMQGEILKASPPEQFSLTLHDRFADAVERWKMDDVLDIFKTIVDPQLIGNAKKIKRYRDWVAHRNEKKRPDERTDPKSTYATLSHIIRDVETARAECAREN